MIPPACTILISIYGMGHNPNLFEDPETFKPERFEGIKTNETQNPFAFIPFSAGPRNCVGQKFGMLEMKTMISKMLRHYEVHLSENNDEELILNAEMVLRPESKVHFKIQPRIY